MATSTPPLLADLPSSRPQAASVPHPHPAASALSLGFDAVDINGDGIISRDEWHRCQGHILQERSRSSSVAQQETAMGCIAAVAQRVTRGPAGMGRVTPLVNPLSETC